MRNFYNLFLTGITLISLSCSDLSGDYSGADLEDNASELIGGVEAISAGNSKFILKYLF